MCRQSKQFEKALDCLERYNMIKDSQFNSDFTKQITEMERKYKSGEKQKEIELLRQHESIQDLQLQRKNITIYASLVLGIALLIFLFMIYRNLQQKKKSHDLLARQHEEIWVQKGVIEEKNKDIIDSINYAQRPAGEHSSARGDHAAPFAGIICVLQPKDIVSGDFYWIEPRGDYLYVAVADCTGHGVPGAIMSIVGNNLLNKILREEKLSSCAAILDHMVVSLIQYLRQDEGAGRISNDGMDISLCRIDTKTGELLYAGAFNPLILG